MINYDRRQIEYLKGSQKPEYNMHYPIILIIIILIIISLILGV